MAGNGSHLPFGVATLALGQRGLGDEVAHPGVVGLVGEVGELLLGDGHVDTQAAEPLDSTRDSGAALRDICDGDDYRNGVAALYAYESQVPEVSRTKREGLAKYYALDDPRAVEFFTIHEEADLRHRAEERAVLARECRDATSRDAAVAAAGDAAQALWEFLDGVYDAYVEPCAKCAA